MAHQSLAQLGGQFGYDNSSMPVDLKRVLRQFQGLRQTVITGGASGAAVSLPSYVTGDQLVSVVSFTSTAAGTLTITAQSGFSYAATFAIKQSTNAASGKKCVVTWFDMSGYNYS